MTVVNVNSVVSLSTGELIDALYKEVVVSIPENVDPSNFKEVSGLLVKLPNDYAFVNELLAHSRYMVRHFKREKQQREYEDMMDKRDALEDIASSIKLKYQAVSRVISSFEMSASYNEMYQGRKGGYHYDG